VIDRRWGRERSVNVIEVDSLDDLIALQDEIRHRVVIGRHHFTDDYKSLLIYDDYME
jgi:hypothetical protein